VLPHSTNLWSEPGVEKNLSKNCTKTTVAVNNR
jgi:hypothetical protein